MKRAAILAALLVACAAPTDTDPPATSGGEAALTASGFTTPSVTPEERDAILARYDNVDPKHLVARSLLEQALVAFDVNKDRLDNKRYLAVVDFSLPSGKRRFFVVNLESGAVEGHVVAHGSGSDPNDTGYAKRFSNTPDSNMSSLGFYATGEIYSGAHGRSLRLDGLSRSNDRVRDRDVVIHGASYVAEGRAKQGRSWGCFALPMDAKDAVIDQLKGEALIYAGLPQD